ncbi:hypothetical protein PSCFBP3800_04788 [Pseudomonas syringae group genomosp. 3]|uniref:Uncharacterized protein n=1 Tax=Pseudomonas syringae group genomosp. 3 TaxID=251701 RepID=A0A2K4WJH8_9PSED|nr:hypothetical protein CFBP6411_04683 [Pseudomonas syringae group genomosp. 3]SPF20241.1 hypothetical protein PSCFBP3800_04788 [Pseudomonas syringae group genomosp. 3]
MSFSSYGNYKDTNVAELVYCLKNKCSVKSSMLAR